MDREQRMVDNLVAFCPDGTKEWQSALSYTFGYLRSAIESDEALADPAQTIESLRAALRGYDRWRGSRD